jgi:hypothetical protein
MSIIRYSVLSEAIKMPVVITADIIESRKHSHETSQLNEKLCFAESPDTQMPFTLLRGDEVQGVLKGFATFGHILRKLRFVCLPLHLRIGIGIGEIEISGNTQNLTNTWQLTGEAFYYARDALDETKKEKKPVTVIRTGDGLADTIAQSVLTLLDILREEWTLKQWKAVMAYEEQRTYQRAAEVLNIPFQNVHKHCERAHWKEYRTAETALESYLSEVHRKSLE